MGPEENLLENPLQWEKAQNVMWNEILIKQNCTGSQRPGDNPGGKPVETA